MHNILLDIIKKKQESLSSKTTASKEKIQQKAQSAKKAVGFKDKILGAPSIAIIAEIKLASPTHPELGTPDDIVQRAIEYESAGADAVSVVIEKDFFKGDIAFIPKLAENIKLPILEKDFVIDAHQIYEGKMVGASAILLIARLVDVQKLQAFVETAKKIGIEPIVEINSLEDLQKAQTTTTSIIAVNARDLTTFEVNVDTACKLLTRIPDRFIKLGFSGVNSSEEVKKYKSAGAKGVLVGTSLMKTNNVVEFIRSLKTV